MPNYRPKFHLSPPTGWLNDPNGLVYHDGEYHLFYQWSTKLIMDGNFMHWAHAVSRDLVHWEHLPISLEPDALGSIWSGSAVIDERNTSGLFGKSSKSGMVAVFTHHTPQNAERQSLAFSADRGRTWTKYAKNPVLGGDEHRDFRDPKVFWHEPTQRWVMIVGVKHQLFASKNLLEWTHLSDPGFNSECPDLFPVPVENTGRMKWVLSLGGRQYCVGEFDGTRFISESGPHEVDGAPDFYASQSWDGVANGRRIWIGWLNAWKYAFQVPEFGARGFMTLPRDLTLRERPEGGLKLIQQPSAEVNALRQQVVAESFGLLPPGRPLMDATTFELDAIIATDDWDRCGFKVRSLKGEETLIGYDALTGQAFVDRERSGNPLTRGRFVAPVQPRNKRVSLRLFVDRSSVEAFFNDGDAVITTMIYPRDESTGVEWFTENGKSGVERLTAYEL